MHREHPPPFPEAGRMAKIFKFHERLGKGDGKDRERRNERDIREVLDLEAEQEWSSRFRLHWKKSKKPKS